MSLIACTYPNAIAASRQLTRALAGRKKTCDASTPQSAEPTLCSERPHDIQECPTQRRGNHRLLQPEQAATVRARFHDSVVLAQPSSASTSTGL